MSSNTEPPVAIIIPCFNRKEITLACIRQLNATGYPNMSIFACDSSSSDGTQQAVTLEKNVRLLDAGASAWWSEAANLGVKVALDEGFTHILLMNDDIEFHQDLITRMMEKNRQYPNCILSPAQHTPTGDFLGIDYQGLTRRMQLASSPDMKDTEVDTTNGCCLLIPASAFQSAGLFDQEHCPHQYGDTQFQIRAAKYGFSTLACPAIRIRQLGATHYFKRLKLGSLFTFKGSPLHFSAYSHFGKALFEGWIPFILFGFRFHVMYIKTLVKALIYLARPPQHTLST